MAVKVYSKVIGGEVFVRCGDIIKSLYADLADETNEDRKKYMRAQIELWEKYDEDILIQAGEKHFKLDEKRH